jgi:hypothetical protein
VNARKKEVIGMITSSFNALRHQGKIANDRTGNPDAFSGLGTIFTMTAPVAGTLSSFVNSST